MCNVILEDSAVIETSIALFLQLPGEDGRLQNLTRCIRTKKKISTDTNIVQLERLSHLIFRRFISKWGLMNCISCEMTALSPEYI